MPHKIEQHDSLSDLEKEHTKSVYLRNKEDKRRGKDYVMSKILGFYKECLELGPKYLTGVDDEGEVTREKEGIREVREEKKKKSAKRKKGIKIRRERRRKKRRRKKQSKEVKEKGTKKEKRRRTKGRRPLEHQLSVNNLCLICVKETSLFRKDTI
ncbi:hypothetical protein Tco_1259595, partial [Tanacetum coccineum]